MCTRIHTNLHVYTHKYVHVRAACYAQIHTNEKRTNAFKRIEDIGMQHVREVSRIGARVTHTRIKLHRTTIKERCIAYACALPESCRSDGCAVPKTSVYDRMKMLIEGSRCERRVTRKRCRWIYRRLLPSLAFTFARYS